MTRVQVAEGQAVNHDGRQYGEGQTLDVEDRLAAKWLERQVVMPAKAPAKIQRTQGLRGGLPRPAPYRAQRERL